MPHRPPPPPRNAAIRGGRSRCAPRRSARRAQLAALSPPRSARRRGGLCGLVQQRRQRVKVQLPLDDLAANHPGGERLHRHRRARGRQLDALRGEERSGTGVRAACEGRKRLAAGAVRGALRVRLHRRTQRRPALIYPGPFWKRTRLQPSGKHST